MSDKKDPSKSPRETNGPVVKTGPTAGQNRSRNDDGAWRKKRSDAGETREKEKSGCFITTTVCLHRGLPDDCHELRILRKFRDEHLLSTEEGTTLVESYYKVAPSIAARLVDYKDLESTWEEVCHCVVDIETKRFSEAAARYAKLVEYLTQHLGCVAP